MKRDLRRAMRRLRYAVPGTMRFDILLTYVMSSPDQLDHHYALRAKS